MLAALALACCGPLGGAEGSGAGDSGCGAVTTTIGQIQGSSSVSPLAGELVAVSGVVSLPLPGLGFHLQSEHPDADPQSSEGLLIRARDLDFSPGDRLFVRGRVREEAGSTELAEVELIQRCGTTTLLPAPLRLDAAGLEPWEHMWVSSLEPWTLIDARDFGRGLLTISRRGRLFAAGHELGTSPDASEGESWRLRVIDEAHVETAPPRLGARTERFSALVQPGSSPVLLAPRAPVWQFTAPRPPALPAGQTLRVASMNVHNYFAELDGRGAASEAELERQRTKLVAALSSLNADILALVELGNSSASVEHLGAGLNARRSPGERYVWSPLQPPPESPLRAALLYRADRVEAGDAWFELGSVFTRPPLFQRFRRGAGELTVGVVHFKSKRCDGEVPRSTLEGCGAETRTAEALELAAVWQSFERAGSRRALLIGDFNADAREAPLLALESAGWLDLLRAVPAAERYSYVYDGRATLLDHALASAELAPDVVSAGIWHINADEPRERGYSLDNPPDQYAPDVRRSSDHDPISVDLRL